MGAHMELARRGRKGREAGRYLLAEKLPRTQKKEMPLEMNWMAP
jgi:hypothetical protein